METSKLKFLVSASLGLVKARQKEQAENPSGTVT
jgi:hypothetical protein